MAPGRETGRADRRYGLTGPRPAWENAHRRHAGIWLAAVIGCPVAWGQSPPPDGIAVSILGQDQVIPARTLDSLARDTVEAASQGGPLERYVGVGLDRVLAAAGQPSEGLRGRQLAQYPVVEARDGYRVVFGMGDLDPSVGGRRLPLVRDGGAEAGPWRLVVSGDRRGARWVRQVRAIRVREAPE